MFLKSKTTKWNKKRGCLKKAASFFIEPILKKFYKQDNSEYLNTTVIRV